MPTGPLRSHRNSLPQQTIDARKCRNGHAPIYAWGGPNQVSASVVKQLTQYGAVQRIVDWSTSQL
jgi:hypothetical protein